MNADALSLRKTDPQTRDTFHAYFILNADALSLRKTDPQTRDTFHAYFEQGLSAAGASDYHVNQLEMGDVFDSSAVARADAKWSTVSYWYRLWRETNLGKRHGEGMCSVLETKLAAYLTVGAHVSISRDPFAVAILTPIMQRAHQLPTAENIAFVDSTAYCDAENRVITFESAMSHSLRSWMIKASMFVDNQENSTHHSVWSRRLNIHYQ